MSESLIDLLMRFPHAAIELAAGETLFRADDPVKSIYLVMKGAIRLVRQLPQGSQLSLQRAAAGSVLAEASVFARRYHCDAVADGLARLHGISRNLVETALQEDPRLARAWAQHLAQELQRARGQAEILSLKTVAERVDAWTALHRAPVPPKGSWQLLAHEIGVSPEALYRELSRRRRSRVPVVP